jgi:hypothetical protein
MSDTPTQYALCRHVKSNGRLCRAAALRDHIFCFHHQRDRQRRANLRAALGAKFRHGEEDFNSEVLASLDLPSPDDPEAVLVCLANTFNALAVGAIPEKRAGLMIFNLQTIALAWRNVLEMRKDAQSEPEERAVTDPEPIAGIVNTQRQADFDFREQEYVKNLATADSDSNSAVPQFCNSAVQEAAFNADAARHQAMQQDSNLPLPAEAPHKTIDVETALSTMKDDDWKEYLEHLWKISAITTEQRDKLRTRLFHGDRNRRAHARFMALKYAPDKVKEVLTRRSESQNEPRIA